MRHFSIILLCLMSIMHQVHLTPVSYQAARSLLAESNPNDLLADGTPSHWSFTRNGTLRFLVVRADFPNGAHQPIPVEGNYNESLVSTSLFFSDSSWGKINFSYTFPPIVNTTTSAASSTPSSIKSEALAALEGLGYVYCGGPCGSKKASKPGQYDAVVLAFVPNPPVVDWAGLGVVGNGFTWSVYPTSPGILEHEIGHNFGMQHGITAKTRVDGLAYNTPTYEGFSRMAGGGSVSFLDQKSRFNSNGHFDAASKHWFGWIEDPQVVFLHPNGSSSACPLCRTSWTGKINACDRPDVVPGNTTGSSGSPYFAVKIAYTPVDVIYIYYRTSYAATRVGVSVQYCQRSLSTYLNSGMTSLCYTYDAAGDTATMDDSTILPGTSFVAAPPPAAIERTGLAGVADVLPVITVNSVTDFSDCPDMICPAGKDISASVSIRFLSQSEVASAPTPSVSIAPSFSSESVVDVAQDAVLIRAADAVQGAGGRSTFGLSVCPTNGLKEVTVFMYDSLPYSTLLLSAPPAYQAANKFKLYLADCCAAGDQLAVEGVRAVVIRQMDTQPLHIAELEVYLVGGTINVASQATCWSLPVGGSWYNGDPVSGIQTFLTDNLTSTFSHSGDLGDGQSGRGHFDICVFDSPLPVERIKVTPRSGWASRSKNLRVETYAHVGSDPTNPSGLRPSGLLWNQTISMPTNVWSQTLRLPALPSTVPCEARSGPIVFSFPAVQGAAYALVKATRGVGSVRIRASWNSTKCPGGSYLVSAGAGVNSCTHCPSKALAFAGNMAVCPGKTCAAVVATGNYTGAYDLSRDFSGMYSAFTPSDTLQAGRPTYTSQANATISWNAGQWQLRDSRGGLMAARESPVDGAFAAQEPGWSSPSGGAKASGGIRAVVIEMDQAQYLNLCEIEMYDAAGINLARSRRVQCFNLPVSTGYWYSSNRTTGFEPRLNDGCTGGQDVCSCSHSGEAVAGNFVACVLDSALPVESIKVYINPSWASRSTKLNLKLYTSLPDGPISPATFATPAASKLQINMALADNRQYAMCYLSVGPSETA